MRWPRLLLCISALAALATVHQRADHASSKPTLVVKATAFVVSNHVQIRHPPCPAMPALQLHKLLLLPC